MEKLTKLMKLTKLTTRRSQRVAHNTGRSSTPAYIENEWQLAAHDAFGVSPIETYNSHQIQFNSVLFI